MNLLCIGSIAYDSIITPFGKVHKTLGGSASYFALASKFFAKASLVGIVGNDFKRTDKKLLEKYADISGIKTAKGKTFHWAGKYHSDLNTRDTLKTELGVFANFKPKLNKEHKKANYIFLGNIHPKLQIEVLNQVKSTSQQTRFVGLDTMNFWITSAKPDLLKVIKQVKLLCINDSEASELAGTGDIIKNANKIYKLMSQKLNPLLIIKQGENGLSLFTHNQKNKKLHGFCLPAYKVKKALDPTGAGDTFAGALMGYLAKQNNVSLTNIKKACEVASIIASFCVEGFGVAKLDKLKMPDVNKRLNEYKNTINY